MKTIDLPRVTVKLYHIMLYRVLCIVREGKTTGTQFIGVAPFDTMIIYATIYLNHMQFTCNCTDTCMF